MEYRKTENNIINGRFDYYTIMEINLPHYPDSEEGCLCFCSDNSIVTNGCFILNEEGSDICLENVDRYNEIFSVKKEDILEKLATKIIIPVVSDISEFQLAWMRDIYTTWLAWYKGELVVYIRRSADCGGRYRIESVKYLPGFDYGIHCCGLYKFQRFL